MKGNLRVKIEEIINTSSCLFSPNMKRALQGHNELAEQPNKATNAHHGLTSDYFKDQNRTF